MKRWRLLLSLLVLVVGAGALSAQTDLLKAYQDRGRILSKMAKHDQALPYFLLALEMAEREFGSDSPEVVPLLNDLADCYVEQRNYADAEPLLLRALAIQERRVADLQAGAARTAGTLATLYEETDRPEDATALYRRILDRWQPALGADHVEVRNARLRLAALSAPDQSKMPPKPAGPHAEAAPGAPAYLVHITSIRDGSRSGEEWSRLQGVYPDLLAGFPLSVTRADLKDRGTYYRIHAGPVGKRRAEDLCAALAARGDWCAVVRLPDTLAIQRPAAPMKPPPSPGAEVVAHGGTLPPARLAPSDTGSYRIHLTSIRDVTAAEAEWARLRRHYGGLLGGLGLTVERADLGAERGVYFRIEGGPLSGERARELCAVFAARDIWCRVVPPGNTADPGQRMAAQRLRDRRSGPRRGTRRGHRSRRHPGGVPERACRRFPRRGDADVRAANARGSAGTRGPSRGADATAGSRRGR